MGSSSPALSNMQFLVLLSAVAMAFANVHDATGDVAVDDSPAALPYVHDATGDVADDASPAYPYTYGAYPYLAAGAVAPKVEVKAAEAPAAVAPVTYAAAPYHTGCVNNVGSVVPCA